MPSPGDGNSYRLKEACLKSDSAKSCHGQVWLVSCFGRAELWNGFLCGIVPQESGSICTLTSLFFKKKKVLCCGEINRCSSARSYY